MANFTFSDFQKALKESGMESGFSQADLRLAENYPDAGMDLLNAKKQWQTATTKEERENAHARAEKIRADYGNYSGGEDGSDFLAGELSYLSLKNETPAYESAYEEALSEAAKRQTEYKSYSSDNIKPTYKSNYGEKLKAALSDAESRGDYSYDPDKSALNSAIKKQYARMIDRATEGTLAAAASENGGLVSSYAVTAAAQAGNLAAAEYADRQLDIAKLENQIYNANYEAALSRLKAVQGAEQTEYDRYLDELSQYNTDEKQDLTVWKENYNKLQNDTDTLSDLEKLSQSAYKNTLDAYNSHREREYKALSDELSAKVKESNDAWDKALSAAKYGDYSGLEALGVDTARYRKDENYKNNLDAAELAAKYGDYSGLEALGIDTSSIRRKEETEKAGKAMAEKIEIATLAAKYGDYSGLSSLGIDIASYQKEKEYQAAVEKAVLAAKYGDFSLLEALGISPYGETEE